jgi:hypothetical protein
MHKTHQFIKILDVDKVKYSHEDSRQAKTYGAIVVCADCGEVRRIWEDSIIEILTKGIWPQNSQSKT